MSIILSSCFDLRYIPGSGLLTTTRPKVKKCDSLAMTNWGEWNCIGSKYLGGLGGQTVDAAIPNHQTCTAFFWFSHQMEMKMLSCHREMETAYILQIVTLNCQFLWRTNYASEIITLPLSLNWVECTECTAELFWRTAQFVLGVVGENDYVPMFFDTTVCDKQHCTQPSLNWSIL